MIFTNPYDENMYKQTVFGQSCTKPFYIRVYVHLYYIVYLNIMQSKHNTSLCGQSQSCKNSVIIIYYKQSILTLYSFVSVLIERPSYFSLSYGFSSLSTRALQSTVF